MFRVSSQHLRLESLEDRSLLASSFSPVDMHVTPLASTIGSQAQVSSHLDTSGSPTNGASAEAESENGRSGQSEENEYSGGGDDDKNNSTERETASSTGESPNEYKSTANALSGARRENPYFFDNKYYAVVAIPPPPAPVSPSRVIEGASAPESQTAAHPGTIESSLASVESAATSDPAQSVPVSSAPAALPESTPELPADPPPVDEQEQPSIPPSDDSAQQPGPSPATLFDELSVRLDVADWEHAAKRLLDGLDRVLLDGTDTDSPMVRLSYWLGTAAALGVAVELTRHGLRARRPRVEFRITSGLPVNR
jgi:hypothetical protein